MSNLSQKPFSGFRGRQGTRRRKHFIAYISTFLGVDTRELIQYWEDLFGHIEMCEGTIQAVKRTKALYDYALRYSCNISTDPLPFVRTDKGGLPKKLRKFKPYLDGTPDARRAALTILQLFKLVVVEPEYSLESITRPYGGEKSPEWIESFKDVVAREFPLESQQSRINQLSPGYHISGSNGPNGPAIGSAFVDREAIRDSNLEQSIKELSSLTKFNYLNDLLAQTKVPCNTKHKRNRKIAHSRIRIKYEPGGKARPFAICDFFSQSALKSIHGFTMDWLKNKSTDSTSEHSRAAQAVRRWSGTKNMQLWSYDLTSATDRFPIFLQEIVMKQMFGDKIAELWKDIIVNRTFEGPKGESVRFETGQPLGALSSWSVFAITHHLLLQTAAKEAINSRRWFNGYRMIGDDICIARSQRVALKYEYYLNTLNVQISLNKSVVPQQCGNGCCGEIAKRLFHNGVEVTPVPPEEILMNFESPIGLKNLIESSWNRGYLRAGSPYPVQSILTSKLGWAAFTFPFRNRTPQFNGVRSLFPIREQRQEPPAGLSDGWFIWVDTSDEVLDRAVRTYLFEKVDAAVKESLLIQQRVLLARYSKSEREELPQGGDWQPGSLDCHPEILTEVFSELQEILMKNQQRLWSDNLLLKGGTDLYAFIGSLHKYLEPTILLKGRSKFIDEKGKTLVFVSKLVKECSAMAKANDWSKLDREPEVESFPLLDDLDFLPLDLPFE